MVLFITLMFAVFGAVLGSFANAWAIRLLHNESIAKGRSVCPKCHHALAWYDNIPIISFLILYGKCRYCKKLISIQYPITEGASAILYAGLWLHFLPTNPQQWLLLALWCILSVFLISAFITDWKDFVLPDRYIIPSIAIGFIIALVSSYIPGVSMAWGSLGARIIQTIIFVLIYSVLYFGSRGKFIGDGDIRLAAVLGLTLVLPQLLVGVFFTYVVGASVGVFCIVTKLKSRKDIIAFGPFLIVGMYFGLFFGNQIAKWYLSFF